MIKEIQAKTILSHAKHPDPWFGIQYTMNLYRGCAHQCIYCDSRSACYQNEKFADTLVKVNALELLAKELSRKREKGTIGTGSMNDPYAPIEKQYQLTRGALQIISNNAFPVHVITKSNLVTRDVDLLWDIQSKSFAMVTFTITTANDDLGKKVEPGAPLVSDRLAAMRYLANNGIAVGVSLMPVLPFIEDNWENIQSIIRLSKENGASYILASFGMTQRPGQQEYYYAKLDQHFPGISALHRQLFGNRYECKARQAESLRQKFIQLCKLLDIKTRIPVYHPYKENLQPALFDLPLQR